MRNERLKFFFITNHSCHEGEFTVEGNIRCLRGKSNQFIKIGIILKAKS